MTRLVLACLFVPILPLAAGAAEGIWVHTDRWPDSRTPETFTSDIFRLDKDRISGDEDRAIAIYRWLTRCYAKSGGPKEGPKDREGTFTDSWKEFHVYGQGLCDRWGRLGVTMARGAGLTARKVTFPGGRNGHTTYEVFYKDRDGQDRWHWFDAMLGFCIYTRDGSRIAGISDIENDPSIVVNYSKAIQPVRVRSDVPVLPVADNADEMLRWKYLARNAVFSRTWPSEYDPRLDLPPGASFTRYWEREPHGIHYDAGIGNQNEHHCRYGLHDPTPPFYKDGAVKDPENYAYWKPYLIDCDACGTKNARPNGHGILRWKPPLLGEALSRTASLAENVVSETRADAPRVHPARAREQGVLIYKVSCPYVIAESTIKARVWRVEDVKGTELAFHVSDDDGKTWHELWNSQGQNNLRSAPIELSLGKTRYEEGLVSAHGTYGYLLRVDMLGLRDPSVVGLDSIEFETVCQFNMFALPFLQPGKNKVYVTGAWPYPGAEVALTYNWDDRAGKGRTSVHRFKTLPAECEIETEAARPDEVRMCFVRLEAAGPEEPPLAAAQPAEEAPSKLAEGPREVVIPFLAAAPQLDGNLGDTAWRQTTPFELAANRGEFVCGKADRTSVRLGHDGDRLYVAMECGAPGFQPAEAAVKERDGAVWKDDSVEIFIQAGVKRDEYWQIAVNGAGAVLDAYVRLASSMESESVSEGKKGTRREAPETPGRAVDSDKSRNLPIRVSARIVAGGWTAEISVPLRELNCDPKGAAPRMNVFRNCWGDQHGGNKPSLEQALCPTGGSYHVPERFVTMRFASKQ